jgi:segregation and condensation protein B
MLMLDEIKASIEAILFISGEKVSREELMELLNLPDLELKAVMQEMMEEYNKGRRGIQIMEFDGGYIMGTNPEYSRVVGRMAKNSSKRLSSAALETLAIIAYRQPVTKLDIEQIRGVKTDRVINSLLEKGIIKEAGRKAAPGKPVLYATTHEFLKIFNLSSLDELPEIGEQG